MLFLFGLDTFSPYRVDPLPDLNNSILALSRYNFTRRAKQMQFFNAMYDRAELDAISSSKSERLA